MSSFCTYIYSWVSLTPLSLIPTYFVVQFLSWFQFILLVSSIVIAIPLDSHFCITFTNAKDNNPGFNSFYVSNFHASVMSEVVAYSLLIYWCYILYILGTKMSKQWHMSLSEIYAPKTEILKTWLLTYQMKEQNAVHHLD